MVMLKLWILEGFPFYIAHPYADYKVVLCVCVCVSAGFICLAS